MGIMHKVWEMSSDNPSTAIIPNRSLVIKPKGEWRTTIAQLTDRKTLVNTVDSRVICRVPERILMIISDHHWSLLVTVGG